MKRTRLLARGAFPAAVAAALVFGAAQAAAEPAAAERRVCDDQTCARLCTAIGARGGFCTDDFSCVCYIGGEE